MKDTTTLIHVQLAELVQLETLRFHFADTPRMVTRSVTIQQRTADTTATASASLRSEATAERHETTRQDPLMAPSKKRGVAWLCPLIVSVCVLFFVFFLFYMRFVKKN